MKEKISIEEFDDKCYQTRLIKPLEEEKAILTHYLHNIHDGISKHYQKDALTILSNYIDYKQEKIITQL